ncbi:1479_t:CDS:2 [Acaulospora colombiana]|uniref:1479_t:CDS:1 n=1 Tax=Acaulospora colombiana TaxID=27376 RepID=A0ACA9Q3F5_9GLOM|nr:1479_t:CDS:2 [Acaulospora colombiana]
MRLWSVNASRGINSPLPPRSKATTSSPSLSSPPVQNESPLVRCLWVSNALIRNGHVVVGVSRSEKQAQIMRANEDIFDPSLWSEHLADTDVVIDCTAGDIWVSAKKLFNAVETAAASVRAPGVPKLAYIYTSGTWVHGDDRNIFRSDSSPLPNPASIVAWRPAFEQEVIASTAVRGIVIRPSCCYGRSGGLFGFLYSQGESGQLSWFSKPGAFNATVHVDDVAEFFLLAAEKNHLIYGLILDCSNEQTESVEGMLYAFAAVAGIPFDKISYREPANVLEEAMAATSKLRPTLARTILGWAPRKASATDGMAVYYEAYKAAQGK